MPLSETQEPSRISVMLVDDHSVVRAGLRMLLDATADIQVVADAESVEVALAQYELHAPDIVVLDLQLGDSSGLDFLEQAVSQFEDVHVVVLTMHETDEYLFTALRLGASGYVLKQSADVDLITAIRAVAAGRSFVDSAMTASLVERTRVTPQADASREPPANEGLLSDRELQVARLVALGNTNAEVGKELHLSVKTVETYRARAMVKLGLESRAQLVRYALEAGWLSGAEQAD
jgi:two-component system response regulator NreC